MKDHVTHDSRPILNDTEGMAAALDWAARGMFITAPNPRIGCVIVQG